MITTKQMGLGDFSQILGNLKWDKNDSMDIDETRYSCVLCRLPKAQEEAFLGDN